MGLRSLRLHASADFSDANAHDLRDQRRCSDRHGLRAMHCEQRSGEINRTIGQTCGAAKLTVEQGLRQARVGLVQHHPNRVAGPRMDRGPKNRVRQSLAQEFHGSRKRLGLWNRVIHGVG